METPEHELLTTVSVIGYDVRRAPSAASATLINDKQRREGLLVPECPIVLSADRSLWPSIFYTASTYESRPVSFADDILVSHSPNSAYFEAFDLWDNVYAMREAYSPTTTGDCGIAVGLVKQEVYPRGFESDSWFQAIHESAGVAPSRPGTDWPFLGFDVANSGFMSAISGFTSLKYIESLRASWAAEMNEYCLFDSRDRSLCFCVDANVRLRGDGPYFSIALFLLWDTSGEVAPQAKRLFERNRLG